MFLNRILSKIGSRSVRTRAWQAVAAADAARDKKDWATATNAYASALRLDPGLAAIWVQYGHSLKEDGRVREAEAAYRRALELNDLVADTHLQLGHALKLQGQISEATASYIRALKIDPALQTAQRELVALGLSKKAIRNELRQLKEAAHTPLSRRVVFASDIPFEDLAPEVRAVVEAVRAEKRNEMFVVRFGLQNIAWMDIETSKPVEFQNGDVLISLSTVSSAFLRAVRKLMRDHSVAYYPIVAFDPQAALEGDSMAVEGMAMLPEIIDHASGIIVPYAATACALERILSRAKIGDVPIEHVRFDAQPADLLRSQSRSGTDAALCNVEPNVLVDLRNANETYCSAILKACLEVSKHPKLQQDISFTFLTDEPLPSSIEDLTRCKICDKDSLLSNILKSKCVVVPTNVNGWASSLSLSLLSGRVPIIGPDALLLEVGSGLAEVCSTTGANELTLRLVRLLQDEKYFNDRCDIIERRFELRTAALVVQDLAAAGTSTNLRQQTYNRRVTKDGYAILRTRLPYCFGRQRRTFRGVPFGPGNYLLDDDQDERLKDWGISLAGTRTELAFVLDDDSEDPIAISVLVHVPSGRSLQITSPHSNSGEAQVVASGWQWISISVRPQVDSGLVSIRIGCEVGMSNEACRLVLLYADVASNSKSNRRFLEALESSILVGMNA